VSSIFSQRGALLKAFLIAAAVLAIYSPVFHGGWLWDDGTLILRNRTIHDSGGLLAIWRGPINGTEYLPLTSSVEWLEWHLWGDDTLGYHLVSILLHFVSALLVWRLLGKLGVKSAWIGGLLFAIHPVAVESVAWISELKNTLSLPPSSSRCAPGSTTTATRSEPVICARLAGFLSRCSASPRC
jgi:hypothetical protein